MKVTEKFERIFTAITFAEGELILQEDHEKKIR
jgi:hypothetical protein